jgi:SAM-dependent methyltransferase
MTQALFDPAARMLGEYLPYDGGIEFFGRVATVPKPSDVVVDLGAGRGAWFYEDRSEPRRRLRDFKSMVARVIGLDVDPVVLTNPTTTENAVIRDDRLPLDDASVDVIVSEYVLEHIEKVPVFVAEIDRVLKPGGYFFARTPHKYHYVSVAARWVRNASHVAFLSRAQPHRKAEDVFPTAYRLNTMADIRRNFERYEDFSYLDASEPSYFFGSRLGYRLFSLLHALLPAVCVANIYVVMRKPLSAARAR